MLTIDYQKNQPDKNYWKRVLVRRFSEMSGFYNDSAHEQTAMVIKKIITENVSELWYQLTLIHSDEFYIENIKHFLPYLENDIPSNPEYSHNIFQVNAFFRDLLESEEEKIIDWSPLVNIWQLVAINKIKQIITIEFLTLYDFFENQNFRSKMVICREMCRLINFPEDEINDENDMIKNFIIKLFLTLGSEKIQEDFVKLIQ